MTEHPLRNKNIIVYGTPRSGSTLFLKLMEQAIEQSGEVIPIVLKEFFSPRNDDALYDRIGLLKKHKVHCLLLKLFVGHIEFCPELIEFLEPCDKNILIHLSRKNKYHVLISGIRKDMTRNDFGDFNPVPPLEFFPKDANHQRFVKSYINEILNESKYSNDNMIKVFYEDFSQNPQQTIERFVEVKYPLYIPMKKQIMDHDNVFINQHTLDEYIKSEYGLTKNDLINFV